MTERADENAQLSDGHRELVEYCADPVAGGDVPLGPAGVRPPMVS
jgi:hypothetical protein